MTYASLNHLYICITNEILLNDIYLSINLSIRSKYERAMKDHMKLLVQQLELIYILIYLYIYLLSIYRLANYISIYLPTRRKYERAMKDLDPMMLLGAPDDLSLCLLSNYMSIYLSNYLSIYLSTIYLSTRS